MATGDVVTRVVAELNQLCRSKTMDFALSVGRLVINRLHGGDLDAWRSRNPKKDLSLRKLARHPQLPMSPGALYRSIAMFELSERIGTTSWRNVSTTHMRLVLPLPAPQQATLLRAVETHNWSVQQLDEAVSALVRSDPSLRIKRGGRPRVSLLGEKMRLASKFLDAMSALLAEGECLVSSPDSVRSALETLDRVGQACTALAQRLSQAEPAATTAWPPPSRGQ